MLAIPVTSTRRARILKRLLLRWSASSLRKMTPAPSQDELPLAKGHGFFPGIFILLLLLPG